MAWEINTPVDTKRESCDNEPQRVHEGERNSSHGHRNGGDDPAAQPHVGNNESGCRCHEKPNEVDDEEVA